MQRIVETVSRAVDAALEGGSPAENLDPKRNLSRLVELVRMSALSTSIYFIAAHEVHRSVQFISPQHQPVTFSIHHTPSAWGGGNGTPLARASRTAVGSRRAWQSSSGTPCASGIAGIEPMPSESGCDWTPLACRGVKI